MGHINIYEKCAKAYPNNMVGYTLTQIVSQNLSDEQLQELLEYFEDNHSSRELIADTNSDYCYEVCNMNEIMEESPLPDGTVINANAFLDCQDYVVLIGTGACNKVVLTV